MAKAKEAVAAKEKPKTVRYEDMDDPHVVLRDIPGHGHILKAGGLVDGADIGNLSALVSQKFLRPAIKNSDKRLPMAERSSHSDARQDPTSQSRHIAGGAVEKPGAVNLTKRSDAMPEIPAAQSSRKRGGKKG